MSIFVDESGGQNGRSKHYVLTLVFHNQEDCIEENLLKHRLGLQARRLEDAPFHASALMTGHDAYEHLDFKTRKSYFSLLSLTLEHLPITYQSFLYKRSELAGAEGLSARMRRDIANLLFDELEYFQSFDKVKIYYYDDGQSMVAHALQAAVEYALSKESILHRKTKSSDFLLSQAADMICTLELTACKYRNHGATSTDQKMFGSASSFKNNYMKAVKRKRLRK